MPLARVTTWVAGNTLTAAALNGEFNNILNNPASLVSTFLPAPTAQGDIIIAASSGTDWVRFAVGTTSQVLFGGTTGPVWAAAPVSISFPITLDPAAAVFSSANFPALVKSTTANWPKYQLAYDSVAKETAVWYVNLSTQISAVSSATMELWLTATSSGGTSVWAINTRTLTSGADISTVGSTTLTSTATSITSTQVNRITAGLSASSWGTPSVLQISIAREVADAGDASTGDQYLYNAALRITI